MLRNPAGAVRIGAYWDAYTAIFRVVEVAPVEVEPVRIGVDLDGDAKLACAVDHRLQVGRVALAFQQDAPSRVAQNRAVGVLHRANQPLCLLLRRQVEEAVDRGHDEIERRQRLLVVVQRAIAQDVALRSLEDAKRARVLGVQRVDLLLLATHSLRTQPTGVGGGAAVIADAEV